MLFRSSPFHGPEQLQTTRRSNTGHVFFFSCLIFFLFFFFVSTIYNAVHYCSPWLHMYKHTERVYKSQVGGENAAPKTPMKARRCTAPKAPITKQGTASAQAPPRTHQRQCPVPSETQHSTLAEIPQVTKVSRQLSMTPGSQMTAVPSVAELFMSNRQTSRCRPTAYPTDPKETQQKNLPSPKRTRPLRPMRRGSSTLRIPLIQDPTGQPGGMQTRACLPPRDPPKPQQRWGRGDEMTGPQAGIVGLSGLWFVGPETHLGGTCTGTP